MASLHASAFAYRGAGCLLLGAAGSGKSSCLAQALVLGAGLISDDQVVVTREADSLYGAAPENIAGVMELHGIGLIRHDYHAGKHALHLAVELGQGGGERLPEPTFWEHEGVQLPLLRLGEWQAYKAAGLLLYVEAVRDGRALPTDWHPLG